MASSIDWDAIAAEVTANFTATGRWFSASGPVFPGPVDWDAIAAEATASFRATGQWFLGHDDGTAPPDEVPEATITGTGAADSLRETAGLDVFLGGSGADSFGFAVLEFFGEAPEESQATVLGTGVGEGARDIVLDFAQGEDVIDLSEGLQWRRRFSADDGEFTFIGTEAFSGIGHEVRYAILGDRTIVQIDGGVNEAAGPAPDGVADAEIELAGAIALTGGDIIL